MKKFLLSAFALAVAFSAAAFNMAPNQKAFTPKAFNGKIEKVAKPAPKQFLKPMTKISSLNDISGEYVMSWYGSSDYSMTSTNITITKQSGNTYKITGWYSSTTKTLTATVDTDAGTLTIARQSILTGTYPCDLVKLDLSVEATSFADYVTDDALVGTIYADGIAFQDVWALYITSGSYAGRCYDYGYYAYLMEPNATMSWTTPYANDTTINVYVDQSNDTVFVSNFGGSKMGGYDAYIVLGENHTFNVPLQQIDSIDEEYGNWYWVGFGIVNDSIKIVDHVGTGTDVSLTASTYWSGYSDTGHWYGLQQPWTITRTDSDVFIWGDEPVIPDVYIMGEVGDQTWAPNAGVQMAYGEETGLYTAEIECKDADNNGYDYFSFTTQLAENADDWDAIAAARFGAVSEGDFLVTDELLGQELSLEAGGDAYKVLKGKYTLTLNYTDMKLIIEKVAEPFIKGDVNGDGEVDVRDITALIDVIMNSITDNPRADVSEDGDIDVRDITALIDIIMNS